jgi:hypothetical protein
VKPTYSFILVRSSRYFGHPLGWPDHFEELAVGVVLNIKNLSSRIGMGAWNEMVWIELGIAGEPL